MREESFWLNVSLEYTEHRYIKYEEEEVRYLTSDIRDTEQYYLEKFSKISKHAKLFDIVFFLSVKYMYVEYVLDMAINIFYV